MRQRQSLIVLNNFNARVSEWDHAGTNVKGDILKIGHVLWIVYSKSGKYFHLYCKGGICEDLSHKNMRREREIKRDY